MNPITIDQGNVQDFSVLLKLDSVSWRKTLKNSSLRELVVNTLFQGKKVHHNQEDGSRETQKIGPVLEVTTSCLHGKHGVEIRIWSLIGDNIHSWVRISHGSNKFVMDSNNNDTEVPEDQPEEQALHLNVKEFAYRSKQNRKRESKELDWYWTRESLSLCVRSFEENNPSSSSFSTSTTRRGWSGSFLEN